MRLYIIKRKHDGAYFVNINGHYALNADVDGEQWSHKSQRFFRTPYGVAGNLRRLCSEPYWNYNAPPGLCASVAKGWKEIAWKNFDESKLKFYEVVVMDVDIISATSTPAEEFIQVDAIRDIPLNKRERMETET